MRWLLYLKRVFLCILAVSILVCNFALPSIGADGEISEEDTYVLDRSGNGERAYFFQSPCIMQYTIVGKTTTVQPIIYTMYNTVSAKHIPTYCVDIHVTAKQGADYRRLNLEDSSYAATSAGMIRAILDKGFYVVPHDGESTDAYKARVYDNIAEIEAACGIEDLTISEAVAATQAAIWRVVHGPDLSYPNFCSALSTNNVSKYKDICSKAEVDYKSKEEIHRIVGIVYDYLLSLEPVEGTVKVVSPTSFTDLNDPIYTLNDDGSYDITVNTSVYVEMADGDSLTVKAKLGDYTAETSLSNGNQTISLTLKNVPASLIEEEVKLIISGYQTSKGYFLFDALGSRTESQTMVGYEDSRLPVYAEVVAKEDRVLNLNKLTTVKVGENSYENKPLSNIYFDVFLAATMEEYRSGAVTLPEDPADFQLTYQNMYVPVAEQFAFTLITDESGKASMNLLHQGLPDGVYILKEQSHPSIVSPIKPMYVYIPSVDQNTKEELYDITLWPKNEVKGGVHIEKDVISIGNNEASVNVYEAHTWIIGSTIPEDLTSGKSYTVSDTLDSRLDYLGNCKVVLETKDGAEVEVLIPDTDYTLTVVDVDSLSADKPSDSFMVDLTGQGMSKILAAIGDGSFADYMLRIYFDARVNANATVGAEIPNQAEVSYRNAVSFDFTAKSEKSVVYTGGFHLQKVDSGDSQKTLAGATFALYRPATLEESLGEDPRLTTIAGVAIQVIPVPFYLGTTLEGETRTSVTTGEDGKISFAGLAYGTYYLVETVAPSGYVLPKEAFEITVDENSNNENHIILITNDMSGVVLPETGGVGTTVFTASGVLLLGVAAILFCVLKRRSACCRETES